MSSAIRERFLSRQREQGLALAAASDLVELHPLDPAASRWIARFRCRGLVLRPEGGVDVAERFDVGIHFGPDYLRRASPFEVLTWLGPSSVFHPNILPPLICIGDVLPGTGLLEIVYRCADVIAGRKLTVDEFKALNHRACVWARRNRDRFPSDTRPLKRRLPARLEPRRVER